MKLNKHTLNCLIILYCLLILLTSIISFNGNLSLNKKYVYGLRLDYLIHAVIFIPWMTLANLSWDGGRKKLLWTAFGVGFCLAFISEIVQIYIPCKVFNPMDMLANVVGVMIGVVIFLLVKGLIIGKFKNNTQSD